MATICLAENSGGLGGIGGGGGSKGQASGNATGAGASDYGFPIIETTTGLTADFDIQLTKDTSGEVPSDLSDITDVWFVAKPSMRSQETPIKVKCTHTNDGVVSFTLGPDQVNERDGVWYAEVMCYEGDTLRQTYRAYLCIRKGMTGSTSARHTITPMDVRMAVMDTSPELNSLLDDLEFSDAMILHAVERCLDEWEETPPRLSKRYTAANFPFREHLIKGTVGYIMQAAMYRYMRNHMRYSAAGITLDKNDKGQIYLQLSQVARMEWKNFIASMKTSMNMDECMGVVSQPWFDDTAWGW